MYIYKLFLNGYTIPKREFYFQKLLTTIINLFTDMLYRYAVS